jgi:hypothetical protein
VRGARAECWLCGHDIDYSIRSGPRAFELDHCLPVSSHPELALEPSNFKPAHAVCNRRRQAAAVEGVAVQSLIGSRARTGDSVSVVWRHTTLKLRSMSKGYGAVQRRVLAQLTEAQDWVSVLELAGDRGGSSRYESTRRAVATLADDGAVDVVWRRPPGSDRYTQLLHVRLAQP